MKKLTASVLLSLLILTFISSFSAAKEVSAAAEKVIRLHVIANSDSDFDQAVKLKVRDGILAEVSSAASGCKSKDEAMAAISRYISSIAEAAEKTLQENGCDYAINCSLSREVFDRRVYEDFTLPAGEYDSLCIRIGEAKGKNWWCVCYPSLCLGAAVSVDDCGVFTEDELVIIKSPEKVRYKLWCFEFFGKIERFLKKSRFV